MSLAPSVITGKEADTNPTTNGEHNAANNPPVDPIADAWRTRAVELAKWVDTHLVNRHDVWGGYYSDQHSGAVSRATKPNKSKGQRGKVFLDAKRIERHFQFPQANHRIGLHTTSAENTCRWVAIDIDAHEGDNADPAKNLDAAIGWYESLCGMGFEPLLFTSNGAGGYHLYVVFDSSIPSQRAYSFVQSIVSTYMQFGLDSAPETFPKQAKLGANQYGNWLRLFGKHHSKTHYSTVYNGERWLEGDEAIEFILAHKGNAVALVPEAKQEPKKSRGRPRGSGGGSVSSNADRVKLLEALPYLSADDYDLWVKVGLALHQLFGGSEEALRTWDEWSRASGKYLDGECANKWASFRDDRETKVNIRKLLQQASEVAGEELKKAFNRIDGLRNYREEELPPDPERPDDPPQTILVPLTMGEILDHISELTDGQPYRVGPALFAHEPSAKDVAWLEKTPATFGWLGSRTGAVIRWREGVGFSTQSQVHEELRRTATNYRAIEPFPHEPMLKDHYYLCGGVEPGDGKHLRKLVGMFAPATNVDHDLILAMCLSTVWGGPCGAMPCFAIASDDGRGAGKSTLANAVASLVGGSIDISPNEDISAVKQRLLSTEALVKRVALIDNLKSLKFSWAELESLITGPQINGKRLYFGDASRPNNLLWIITVNGANFSEDMSQRNVIIKLSRQKYSPTFHDDLTAFIEQHRNDIIADCVGMLRQDGYELPNFSRWSQWERGVLSRVAEPTECQRVIVERQGATNVDEDEADLVEDHVGQQLAAAGYQPETSTVRIPTKILCRWYYEATNDRSATAGRVGRVLGQWVDERKLQFMSRDASRIYGRCWIWRGSAADPTDTPDNDLEGRIDMANNDRGQRW